MRYPHLTARIFNTPLLIHPQKLDAIISGLGSRIVGLQVSGPELNEYEVLAPELFSTKKAPFVQNQGYKIIDGVAVMSVSGATVHRSRMEGASTYLIGYDDITRDLEHAMNNSDVHAILRVYDSPGGEAQGAFEHVDRIASMIGKKPMYSIADGMAVSAGYLAASAADKMFITKTGYAGSIGVVMRHIDVSRAMANEGVQVTHIFAGAHKVDGHQFAPLPDAVRADYQEEANSLYAMFVNAVAQNRSIPVDAVRATEAATYMAVKAVEKGLADGVSTTDALIAELAGKRSTRIHSIPSVQAASDKENATLSGMQQAEAASLNSTKGVTTMTLEELRLAHPALCAALVEEGRVAGFEAGASAETNRIKDVEAQTIKGHESLIGTLKFDGKTTGPEAAVKVLAAEKELQAKAVTALINSAPKPIANAAAPDDAAALAAEESAQAEISVEAKAKAEWDASADLRGEYGNNFKTFLAYKEAVASGRVKVAGKAKG